MSSSVNSQNSGAQQAVTLLNKAASDTAAQTKASAKGQDAKEYATALKNTFDDILSLFF